jgi:hypothetical protein
MNLDKAHIIMFVGYEVIMLSAWEGNSSGNENQFRFLKEQGEWLLTFSLSVS